MGWSLIGVPLLVVWSVINRYYVLDLAEDRSFVEHALNQGIQVFVTSWRNPSQEHGHWDLDTYAAVLEIPACIGAKHSSLHRRPEWDRLALRDARRPEFLVLTGNDLAIDMVRWGSDYLLGLSACAPDAFARRDQLWEAGDDRAFELDDALQALGAVAFRDPVPAYRHDVAMVWRRRGWSPTADVHPASPTRPDGEVALLDTLLDRLDDAMARSA